jgi:hypothetical protein
MNMNEIDIDKLPGLKRKEIEKCAVCLEGVAHNRQITFYRVTVERFILDHLAIQRTHGLEQFFGGGSAGALMANVMGTDEDLAKQICPASSFILCEECAMKTETNGLAYILEAINERKSESEQVACNE